MMRLREMEFRNAGVAVIFLILLSVSAMADSGDETNSIKAFSTNDGGEETVPLQIQEKMAEQPWICCRKKLKDKEDLDSHFPNAATEEINSALSNKKHRSIREQKPLYDCLKMENIMCTKSTEDCRYWLKKCVELVFDRPNSPRRNLGSRLNQIQEHVSPSPSPNDAPSPSFSEPISPPPLELQLLILAPIPSPPSDSIEVDVPPPAKSHLPIPKPTPSSTKQEQWQSIVMISATAGAAVMIIGLILCCCIKSKGNKVVNAHKDDRPLLNFSLSDFSAGSSSNKEFGVSSGKITTLASILSMKPEDDTFMAESELSSATFPPLRLPPGRPGSQPQAPPTPPPPTPPPPAPSPPPPPPPRVTRPPPLPPKAMPGKTKLTTSGAQNRGNGASSESKDDDDSASQRAKLKPFFWDKVLANPDQSMVWHDISAGSFQFNEEMIESLFGYANVNKNKMNRWKDSPSLDPSNHYIQIIDGKKAQNLSILLRALNITTEEVIDALKEGNELPVELLQTLLKMAPTTDEELKLRLFSGDLSHLGPAERFLKLLVDIPFSFKRIDSLLFMCSLQEELSAIKESFATLEVACNKLRHSRLFLKLLEAVLKTGNRMNDGTFRGSAQAFKLDTLLKLADVKGTDGKTTLLHFVVQEIIRSEGIRAARTARESRSMSSIRSGEYSDDVLDESADHYRQLGLQVVSGLSTELVDVKKASVIDADGLTATVSRLGNALIKTRDFLANEMSGIDEESKFYRTMTGFVERKEQDIVEILEEEKKIRSLVKSTGDYFHGNSGKDEGLRLFVIVRDFLTMLDKACKDVRDGAAKKTSVSKKVDQVMSPSRQQRFDIHQRLFPVIAGRRNEASSSDDEASSP